MTFGSRRCLIFVVSGQPDTKRAFHTRFASFFNSVPGKSIAETQFLKTA